MSHCFCAAYKDMSPLRPLCCLCYLLIGGFDFSIGFDFQIVLKEHNNNHIQTHLNHAAGCNKNIKLNIMAQKAGSDLPSIWVGKIEICTYSGRQDKEGNSQGTRLETGGPRRAT